jgi:hypothetical protein
LEYAYEALAAHQADVALAWFQEHTTEEWGVRSRRAGGETRIVRVGPGYTSAPELRRRVTAWEEAK